VRQLQTFSFDLQVSPEDGREDKIELELGDWFVAGTPARLDDLRDYLAVAPALSRAGDSIAVHEYGWMFNRPREVRGRRKPLVIRSHDPAPWVQDGELSEPLLFGGEWTLQYSGTGGGTRNIGTSLQLSLNPLRFVRNQPRTTIANPASWPPPRITKLPNSGRGGGEFSLDGRDNWLPDTPFYRRLASNERWPLHLQRYIAAVTGNFRAELNRVANGRATIDQQPDFSLRKVETVWEFAHPSPTELVATLAPLLIAYTARDTRVQHFPPTESTSGNCLCVQIGLRAGVHLRVYGKTNRRVRFEIIQDEINVRENLGEPVRRRSEGLPRQPRRPWRQIVPCLTSLRVRAAEELNTVFAYLNERNQITTSPYSAMRFIVAISTALHDADMSHTILSLLVTQKKIVAREASTEVLDAAQLLADAGVLTYSLRRRVYEVTLPYRTPLATLRRADLRHLCNGGVQRRQRREN
jgi:hypothetical protein